MMAPLGIAMRSMQWLDRMALRDPQIFLQRLSQVVDVIVGDAWWFERDEVRKKFD